MGDATSKVVRGHGLKAEGMGYEWAKDWRGVERWLIASDQRNAAGLCRCGEASEPLPSQRARQQWHREHKAAVLTEKAAS